MKTKLTAAMAVTALSCLALGSAFAVQGCSSPGGAGPISGTPGQDTAGNVVTYHNDNFRTGQNPFETTLTPANVNASTFGKIAAVPVDGVVYAQPLFIQNVPGTPVGTKNLVIVATEHDTVYAFDADMISIPGSRPVWQRSFISPTDAFPCTGCTTLDMSDVTCPNLSPAGTAAQASGNTTQVEVGITATPVAGGKVFVGGQTELSVYGLKGQ